MPDTRRYVLDAATCPKCNSGDLTRFDAAASDTSPRQSIHIVECRHCALAWQFPASRTSDQSAAFFETAYRVSAGDPSAYFHPVRRRATAALQVAAVNEHLPSKGRLLDVGGGNGYFAAAAHAAGWETTLADPALDPAEFTAAPFRAIQGTTSAIDSGPFDVITLWDVIEHLSEPTSTLREVSGLLKPGGTLVVETGNYKSVERITEGRTHWIYQADHRWYLSPESVVEMLLDLGFVDVDVHPSVIRPEWAGETHYPGPSRKKLLRALLARPTAAVATLTTFKHQKTAAMWKHSGLGIFTVFAKKIG